MMNSLSNQDRREVIQSAIYLGANIWFLEPPYSCTIEYTSTNIKDIIHSNTWIQSKYMPEINELVVQVFETILHNDILKNDIRGIIIQRYGNVLYYFENTESVSLEYTIIPLELIAEELKQRYSSWSAPIFITILVSSCIVFGALYNFRYINKK